MAPAGEMGWDWEMGWELDWVGGWAVGQGDPLALDPAESGEVGSGLGFRLVWGMVSTGKEMGTYLALGLGRMG